MEENKIQSVSITKEDSTSIGETKKDRFKRLARKRVTKILKAMDTLSNLSNKAQYEFTTSDVSKVLTALRDKIDNLEYHFGGEKQLKSEGFKFEEKDERE